MGLFFKNNVLVDILYEYIFTRKENREKFSEKAIEKKRSREESTEEENSEPQYQRHRKPTGSMKSFRRSHHSEERRGGQGRDRSFEHKRSFEYQRQSGFHRDPDYPRGDVR